jgi:membrane protease YdiL (CAAX protease family)
LLISNQQIVSLPSAQRFLYLALAGIQKMKKYIFPLTLFIIAQGLGILIYKLLELFLIKDYLSLIMRIFLSILFFIFTIKYIKKKKSLFNFSKVSRNHIYISLFLCLLFAINNYLLANFSTNTEFMENSVLKLVIIGFVINSFYEEFAYRGFIQSYVNQDEKTKPLTISKGNLFASSLMLISHFGFFTVMDNVFAISGLILVLIFSLSVGYIRDNGGSIWFVIILHTIINFIHLIFNIEHYL